MIYSISSTLPSFKSLTFTHGLNLILADKSPGATDRQTRNSAGKSSIIEIIHHSLGGSCGPNSIFRDKTLVDEEFYLSLNLGTQITTVSRRGNDFNRVYVDISGSDWPYQPTVEKKDGETYLSNKKWNKVLGHQMFGIDADEEPYGPSFRSMLSYFVRRESSGGFQHAEQHAEKQSLYDIQVNLSYLLGLDWEVSRSLQKTRLKEKGLKALKKEAKSGVIGDLVGRSGELRTRLTLAETKVKKLTAELESFQVLPEYSELENEASVYAIEISNLTNENTIDHERIKNIEKQLSDEKVPYLPDIEKMYNEISVVLPDLVIKRLSDVEQFHEAIVQNRLAHLKGEIQAAQQRIDERTEIMTKVDNRRKEILRVLNTHGAIDQMTKLQTELSTQVASLEDTKKRLELARQIESTDTALTIERAQLRQELTIDIEEHNQQVQEAIVIFEEFSQRISDHEGSLTIDPTDNGPEFSIKVEGGRSKGVRNMQIFCFDMTLAVLWSRKNSGPGFLVHDSHLFDGMDSRQIAKAIEIGAEQSSKHGFQYIVTLNSDVLASAEFSNGFDPTPFINPIRLKDENETGGLFGVRI
ncbi:ABC-three component system protein [Gimesia maris]|uniref:ABC-three component system protein n=1 Tax=Gimesia maris TaxID=122 RepID=UPI003A927B35